MPKVHGHCPIFTEVIAKKNIKQTDKFTICWLRKFLEQILHEVEIFPTKKKSAKSEHSSRKYRWTNNKDIHLQTNFITSSFGKTVKKQNKTCKKIESLTWLIYLVQHHQSFWQMISEEKSKTMTFVNWTNQKREFRSKVSCW